MAGILSAADSTGGQLLPPRGGNMGTTMEMQINTSAMRARAPVTLENLESRQLLSISPSLPLDLNVTHSSSEPRQVAKLGDLAIFTAQRDDHRTSLWATDGTTQG